MARIILVFAALGFIFSSAYNVGSRRLETIPRQPNLKADKEVAVTFDDLPFQQRTGDDLKKLQLLTARLVSKITSNKIPAVAFVNEGKLFRFGEMDGRVALLKMWLDAGLELGNHTFSHFSLLKTPLSAYEDDVIRGETVTAMLMREKGMKLRYFRHPFLHVGQTLEVRTEFEKFLAGRGYTIAPVTIDNDDYIFDVVYSMAARRGDNQTMKDVAEAYLAQTQKLIEFYEKESVDLLGYNIKHVMLVHANSINADYFDRVVELLKSKGYRFISLEEALKDRAYGQPDTYAGAHGMSWLHHWAVTKGKEIRWQPDPPESIMKMYKSQ
jgi:peptidoglycan/xylan/chitin deacetylase (PgdA/CDA1 family)